MLAFFFNAAVRQQCRAYLFEMGRLDVSEEQIYQPDILRGAEWGDVRALLSDQEFQQIRTKTLNTIRGTIQTDIPKEDQAQNTCMSRLEDTAAGLNLVVERLKI